MKVINFRISVIFLILIIGNLFVWKEIIFDLPGKKAGIYFLDVGQGDSELIVLQNGVKILIDGGPDSKILEQLGKILSASDRRIDLAVLSHPHQDHFSGLIDVIKRYEIGVFLSSEAKSDSTAYKELSKEIENRKIPRAALAERDKIIYADNQLAVLSPPGSEVKDAGKDINDASLVLDFNNGKIRAIFPGDIGKKEENYLLQKYDLKADVLKVPHHGSKSSLNEKFFKNVSPKISVIEVGLRNRYKQPNGNVLSELEKINSRIFRTDLNGLIKVSLNNNQTIGIYSQK